MSWGDKNIINNDVKYTFYLVLVKPLMIKNKTVVIIIWIFTIGLLFILPFGWTEFTAIKWEQFNNVDITCIILVVFTGN